ncbi:GspE/PulE family protein [Sulfurospirillum barnesii]|uniref:Type II secretory pathway, ATPase PulE/Tfp pilus assembly pathway, ATPase PilB n=1 Tax=Sulfurospirillum barnesii (strain ATCC 700032 / DSM 10660 / SES-3) TaxID=760154 RepID=I3XX45_SULBS|nr:GspE/PulE family protein [Sulfurospirillum barnesii]AFL68519.1 type II secretory pathway, ATPase PulE/Tfp pilus assembly pathway, ATPase PilB [Sulfurospirillum barnesii SES-3]
MSDIISPVLTHLIHTHLIDEPTATRLREETKIDAHKILGEILMDNAILTKEDMLSLVIECFKKGHISLDDVDEHFAIEDEIFLKALAKNLKCEYLDLDSIDIDYRLASKLPFMQLKKFKALPIKEDEINIYVALKDPLDLHAQEGIQRLFPRKLLKIIIAQPMQIDKYLVKMELGESIKGLIGEIRKEISSSAIDNPQESSGILKLIEIILKTSILARASDIHIEPTENNCIVRSRIDGMLTETFIFDKDIYPPLGSRMKLLSNMDIAEKRKPQDGRFSATILNREYDFRISALPTINGESIVIRILDKSKVMIKIEDLGMHPHNYVKFEQAMHSPYGIILVTGPTGSGKTTTLYAALNAIKSVQTKIITVEDPVEYQLTLTQQVQVNEKANLTFASALRSILRQDPDVIMIGEIRDTETLRIAVQAALTGHLVFSTLHTNDAVSAVTRVVDMGIEPYLMSGSLIAIEAQRLVRKLCPHCKVKHTLPKTAYDEIKDMLPENYQFYKNTGCEKCSQTGYLGREMISEILVISEKISSMIAQGAGKSEIKAQALLEGFIDMYHDGIIRAANGVTTLDEIIRVAKE